MSIFDPDEPGEVPNLSDPFILREYLVQLQDEIHAAYGDASEATSAILATMVNARGDLIVGTSNDAVARLPVGPDGTQPVADSSQAGGIRWTIPSDATVTIGLNEIGSERNGLSNGVKYGSRFVVPGDMEIEQIQVPFEGSTSISGTQVVKVVIHADTGSSTEPGALLATSDEITIAANEPIAWRTFTLAAPLALTTGYVWLGFHGGGTGGVGRYSYTGGAGGGYVYRSDTYAGGADASFGAGTFINQQMLNIRATSVADSGQPGELTGQDDGAGQGTFNILNAAAGITLAIAGSTATVAVPAVATLTTDVASLDGRVTTLEEAPGGGGGGGGIVSQVLLEADPLASGVEYVGTWVNTGTSGAVYATASAVANGSYVMYLESSPDGTDVNRLGSKTSAEGATRNVTIEADDDTVTSNGHGFMNGDPVRFPSLTGGTGLTAGSTVYYVRDRTANTFKVAATLGGAAVNVTVDATAGTVVGTDQDAELTKMTPDARVRVRVVATSTITSITLLFGYSVTQ